MQRVHGALAQDRDLAADHAVAVLGVEAEVLVAPLPGPEPRGHARLPLAGEVEHRARLDIHAREGQAVD